MHKHRVLVLRGRWSGANKMFAHQGLANVQKLRLVLRTQPRSGVLVRIGGYAQ
jgi:hypothetical protein